ncbi:hypothetical protein, partial [Bacteriophage sp.]
KTHRVISYNPHPKRKEDLDGR